MMPRYMLDTNMCLYLIQHQPEQVAQRFSLCAVGEVVMSAITYAELEYGVAFAFAVVANRVQERQHLLALLEDIIVVPFDQIAGSAYGPVRYATRESRKEHLDKLIAAHAIALQVVLVTNNTKDFGRYPELRMENWLD
jgi:tRNA(fMet)-specific endonuclease VapC